jgi:hypothetical protein
MDKEKAWSRRVFLKGGLLAASNALISCTATPQTHLPTLEPLASTPVFTPEKKPTLALETPIPSAEAFLEKDFQIKNLLEQARKDEILQLDNVLTKHIFRFPWEGGEAYLATLGALTQEEESKIIAITLSADCLYEIFKKENLLDENLFPGVWKPEKRVDQLTGKVLMPAEIGVPLPILNLQSLTYKNLTQFCQEETALERLKKLVSKINWQQLPEDTGEFFSWFSREFSEGLKKGWQE